MRVTKRNGYFEDINLNKITNRIDKLIQGILSGDDKLPELNIDPIDVSKDVCSKITNGIHTNLLDEFAADICIHKATEHIDFGTLASRIMISNHHKNNRNYMLFSDMTEALYRNINEYNEVSSKINQEYYNYVMANKSELNNMINHNIDYNLLDFYAVKTLQKSYLIKCNAAQECFQHLLMRVSVAIYMDDSVDSLNNIRKCYNNLSNGYFIHATPTLFNAGTNFQQLSSCFLLGVGDSVDSMYETTKNMSIISKWSGGIGVHINNIRSNGAEISRTNGHSKGIVGLHTCN
jgi:ribonucleoside-diphosphate reductase subunit M1